MPESLTTTRARSTAEQRGWYWYDWANTRFELSVPEITFQNTNRPLLLEASAIQL